MPTDDKMVDDALSRAQLSSVNAALANHLVSKLLDDGNLSREALQELSSTEEAPYTSTNALIISLQQESKRHPTTPNSAMAKQQDLQFTKLLEMIRKDVDDFEAKSAADAELINLIKPVLNDLYTLVTGGYFAQTKAALSIWGNEEKLRELLLKQSETDPSPEMLALMKTIQPLISLMACGEFLFPESSNIKKAKKLSPTAFVWFHKCARFLFARIDLSEKNRLAAAKAFEESHAAEVKAAESASRAEQQSPNSLAQAVELNTTPSVPEAPEVKTPVPQDNHDQNRESIVEAVFVDPIEQKIQELSAARLALTKVQGQLQELEAKRQDKIQQLTTQAQILKESLPNPAESKARLDQEPAQLISIDNRVTESKSVLGQFNQDADVILQDLAAGNLTDLQSHIANLGTSHDETYRQEKAKLSSLETKLAELNASRREIPKAPTQEKINLLMIALKATSPGFTPEEKAQAEQVIKDLSPEKFDLLIDQIKIDEATKKTHLEYFNKIRNPAPAPASGVFWWTLTTYVISEKNLNYAMSTVIGDSTPFTAIVDRLTVLNTMLDLEKGIAATTSNLAALEWGYSDSIQGVSSQLDKIVETQQTSIKQSDAEQVTELTALAAAKTKEIASLQVDITALQEKKAAAQAAAAKAAAAAASAGAAAAQAASAEAAAKAAAALAMIAALDSKGIAAEERATLENEKKAAEREAKEREMANTAAAAAEQKSNNTKNNETASVSTSFLGRRSRKKQPAQLTPDQLLFDAKIKARQQLVNSYLVHFRKEINKFQSNLGMNNIELVRESTNGNLVKIPQYVSKLSSTHKEEFDELFKKYEAVYQLHNALAHKKIDQFDALIETNKDKLIGHRKKSKISLVFFSIDFDSRGTKFINSLEKLKQKEQLDTAKKNTFKLPWDK